MDARMDDDDDDDDETWMPKMRLRNFSGKRTLQQGQAWSTRKSMNRGNVGVGTWHEENEEEEEEEER